VPSGLWRVCCYVPTHADTGKQAEQATRNQIAADLGPHHAWRAGRSGHPTPELGRIVGTKPLSRGAAIQKLWEYIKKHDLQDPQNRRIVRADDNLRPIFEGHDSLSMFEMTAYVSRHLIR
jgi:chromatin remodeling complex protein RSC6